MDPTAISSMGQVSQFGFNAVLVVVLLGAIYKMLERDATSREKREERETTEREAWRHALETDRQAHIAALDRHGQRLENATAAVDTLGRSFSQLVTEIRDGAIRLVKGG